MQHNFYSMTKKIFILGLLVFYCIPCQAQDLKQLKSIGFFYGFGHEIKNRNYRYANNYYKFQLGYELKETKNFKYELFIQPEINFATHQLLNLYFVTPEDPNYLEKRERFTQVKQIKEYILGFGLCVRKPISKRASVYGLLSIGPAIVNKETERLSKGFTFADVLALGFAMKVNKFVLDFRPSFRHISNGGLGKSNAGFNSGTIEFGIIAPL
jgi:hypothetical protein